MGQLLVLDILKAPSPPSHRTRAYFPTNRHRHCRPLLVLEISRGTPCPRSHRTRATLQSCSLTRPFLFCIAALSFRRPSSWTGLFVYKTNAVCTVHSALLFKLHRLVLRVLLPCESTICYCGNSRLSTSLRYIFALLLL